MPLFTIEAPCWCVSGCDPRGQAMRGRESKASPRCPCALLVYILHYDLGEKHDRRGEAFARTLRASRRPLPRGREAQPLCA
jgi:hypothetical protein